VACVVLAIINSLVTTSVPRRMLVAVGVVLLGYEALGFRSMKHEQYFLYLLGAWVGLGLTLNGILYGEWVQESVYLPGNIAIALALCRGQVRHRTAKLLFYAAAAYFGYRLSRASAPDDLYRILTLGSANGISELMLLLCAAYYGLARAQGARIPLLPAAVCLTVSAMTLGRSGMIAAALLLAALSVRDVATEKSEVRLVAKLVGYSVIATALAIVVLPKLASLSYVFERFQQFGLGSADRQAIWADYLRNLGGIGLLLGYGRTADFAGFTNVHNSYLLWHKSLGILALPLYGLAVLALVRAFARDWVLFAVLSALLLRSFFDETLLPFRLYDFVFYYLVCTILVTLPPLRWTGGGLA
jgi:hypothetical protein